MGNQAVEKLTLQRIQLRAVGISLIRARASGQDQRQIHCLRLALTDRAVPSGGPHKHHTLDIRHLAEPIRDVESGDPHGSVAEAR